MKVKEYIKAIAKSILIIIAMFIVTLLFQTVLNSIMENITIQEQFIKNINEISEKIYLVIITILVFSFKVFLKYKEDIDRKLRK